MGLPLTDRSDPPAYIKISGGPGGSTELDPGQRLCVDHPLDGTNLLYNDLTKRVEILRLDLCHQVVSAKQGVELYYLGNVHEGLEHLVLLCGGRAN